MTWNPFEFQYGASYLGDEGAYAVLELKKGAQVERIYFPKSFLPKELQAGSTFVLKAEDAATAQSSEAQALKELLENLIQ